MCRLIRRVESIKYKTRIPKVISTVLSVVCTAILITGITISDSLPALFKVSKKGEFTLYSQIPISAETENTSDSVFKNTGNDLRSASLKLFGTIPIKDVTLNYVDTAYVVVSGESFGIKIFTDGVMIVGMTGVETADGTKNPAEDAGLKAGDIILAIDNKTVSSNSELSAIIRENGGKTLTLTVRRKSTSFSVDFTPVKSCTDDTFKAGMWVRDSSAGIGTLTFYCPNNGIYAGLGHAVCDVDTGDALPVLTGQIVGAEITDIVKGKKGTAGEIRGRFMEEKVLGNLLTNQGCGVYGEYYCGDSQDETVRVAMRQEVKTGSAQILTSVSGEPKYYNCEIEKINLKDSDSLQNMVIKVTDDELIALTGGIVQGMSGSPIIQNGMLVGAVTHVFVNEPLLGYGVFAETMLDEAVSVGNQEFDRAS